MSKDGPSPEEEYFHREDQERLRKLKEQMEQERLVAEKASRKALHGGRCGKCGGQMNPRLFKGVEIDVCPDCGAVLLDPGELETLVGADKAASSSWVADFFSFTRSR